MAKGPATKQPRRGSDASKPPKEPKTSRRSKAAKGADTADEASSTAPVGPPLLLVALGFASVLASLPLIVMDGIPAHVIGYVTGALIPILVIGLVRRVDLDRRRSPYYVPKAFLQPALVTLAAVAIVAAGLHVWPIATELAS